MFDETTPQRLVDGAVERFGKVTHVVPNVGILHHYGPLLTIKRHRFVNTVIGNTWFAVELIQRATDAGMAEAQGAVCVISSIGAEITSPVIAAYDGAKTLLNALTRALARELGPRGYGSTSSPPASSARPRPSSSSKGSARSRRRRSSP